MPPGAKTEFQSFASFRRLFGEEAERAACDLMRAIKTACDQQAALGATRNQISGNLSAGACVLFNELEAAIMKDLPKQKPHSGPHR